MIIDQNKIGEEKSNSQIAWQVRFHIKIKVQSGKRFLPYLKKWNIISGIF